MPSFLLPSASADTATVRAWFESHFQPYQVFNENGGKTGTYTGYYSPVIPARARFGGPLFYFQVGVNYEKTYYCYLLYSYSLPDVGTA